MTDPNGAQAAVLIAALTEQLLDMTPKLLTAERQADRRHAIRARTMRQVAAELRRDQFLITRLRHRFPAAEAAVTNELPDTDTATASVDGTRPSTHSAMTSAESPPAVLRQRFHAALNDAIIRGRAPDHHIGLGPHTLAAVTLVARDHPDATAELIADASDTFDREHR
ncbi:hypothetical protein [Mycobacterium sp. 141]|uniref:hypothetical protein n=1 Tax=Mycobacterium sp. 141 TaxID=1120797 RepID=UPI00036FD2F2|nr:hypothetical protein [Mycobacterium sp. 141]